MQTVLFQPSKQNTTPIFRGFNRNFRDGCFSRDRRQPGTGIFFTPQF